MFCPKCGAQLPDDSKFCPICGVAVGAEETSEKAEETPKAAPEATAEAEAAPSASGTKKFGPEPLGAMKTFGPKGAFRIPNIPGFVMLAIAQIVFILAEMSLWKATVTDSTGKFRYAYSLFAPNIFRANVFLGFAKIFVVLSILVAIAYFAYFFIDFAKLTDNKIPQKLLNFLPLAYYGLVLVALFFTFIGAIALSPEKFYYFFYGTKVPGGIKLADVGIRIKHGPSFGWFVTLLFAGAGAFFSFAPSILDTIVGKIIKKK